MDKEQRRAAKAHLVARMQAGQSWQTAAAQAGLGISQSNAYRLWGAFRQRGETALSDGRHGHPIKLRGEARSFLEDACRKAPSMILPRIGGGVEASSILLAKEEKDHGKGAKDLYRRV